MYHRFPFKYLVATYPHISHSYRSHKIARGYAQESQNWRRC